MNNIFRWISAHILALGLAFLLAVNAVVLGGAWFNRSGTPDSTLRLSERELHPPYWGSANEENSAIKLRLDWRILPVEAPLELGKSYTWGGGFNGGNPHWLDEKKMLELGFTASVEPTPAFERAEARDPSKVVFLVLEFDGAAYQEALARTVKQIPAIKEHGAKLLSDEKLVNSRLFVVDAGLDREALRAKYPSTTRYAIVRGHVGAQRHSCPNCDVNMKRLRGYIDKLNIEEINVDLEYRSAVEGNVANRYDRGAKPDNKTVHYEIEIAYGQRLEPWIVSVTRK
jgi:Domain of unknown function (DUF4824)